MTKIITDNSKVNINLLKENEFLKKEIEKANLVNIDLTEQLRIAVVSNWVTIESNIPPEKCTEVMVKYKDGSKAVAFFDGDSRFYTLRDDMDISEDLISWHKLP